MTFEIVNAAAQPMLFVTRTAGMDSTEIAGIMGEAFGTMAAFMGRNGIAPAGAPLAIYRDWDGKTMKVDVGFPVSSADAAITDPPVTDSGVKSGWTPDGKALKAVHRGAYSELRRTYDAMESHVNQTGMKTRDIAWEVYVNDPDQTPEGDLLTEIYMPLA